MKIQLLPLNVLAPRAPRAGASPPDGGEELVHQLRNILAGMTYGIQALVDAHRRDDKQAAAQLEQAMEKQVELLREAVSETARLVGVRGR